MKPVPNLMKSRILTKSRKRRRIPRRRTLRRFIVGEPSSLCARLCTVAEVALLLAVVPITACHVTATHNGSSSVDLTFSVSTPRYESITFPSTDLSVTLGDPVVLTPTNAELIGLAGWRWYIDGQLDATQVASTFVWDTTGQHPGSYVISASVVYGGVTYSGSLRVTVTS